MGLHLSRTLTIKAVGLMAVVFIIFNLILLQLEIKFNRSPLHSMNLTSHTSSLQWPKIMHTNHHPISRSAVTSANEKQIINSNETNFTNQSATTKISKNHTFSDGGTNTSSSWYVSNLTREDFVRESRDFKINGRSHSEKVLERKTKYQDFDASFVPGDGILSSTMKVQGLKQCPKMPPNLTGPIEVDKSPDYLETVEKIFSLKVQTGGRYTPSECRARDRVAIVIPYRDRKQHLPILLKNLHPFLMKQEIDYGIFLIEQSPDGSFNRGKLMNIGFVEALKIYDWDCFIFHDVDLLPMDDRNLYNCPIQPRHMSMAIDIFKWQLPFPSIFGGVSAMTTKQFKSVNGFSNSYFGWGGEDNDLAERLKHEGYHIARYPANIARYTMLSHKKEKPNSKRYEILASGANRLTYDGLNSLKYKLLEIQARPLYTRIYVDVTPDSGVVKNKFNFLRIIFKVL